MASQSWVSLVNAGQTGPGTSLASATTATISPCQAGALTADVAVVNAGGQPLGWYPGMIIRVTARGFITTTTTAGTLTFLLTANKGNNNSYTTLATSTTFTTTTSAFTGLQWKLEAVLQCTAVAASGSTVSTQGEMVVSQTTAAQALSQTPATTNADYNLFLPAASGATAAAVDTTQLTGIGLRVTQATSACTVSCQSWLVEALD